MLKIPYIWQFSRGFNFRCARDLPEIAKIDTAKKKINRSIYLNLLRFNQIEKIGLREK